jgi:glucokinase
MGKLCFGVDLGGTSVKLGLFDDSGKCLDKWEFATRKEEGGKYILSDIGNFILKKIEEKKIARDDVIGIGIGVPGPVIEESVVSVCVNLGWGKVNVAKTLSEITGFCVKAANDANVAALGEMWQGGGKGHKNLVMVTLGTGVGGGIIVNGHIISGSSGAGGEIGHMTVVDGETESCTCGNRGCLEQVASATGIVKETRKLLKSEDRPSSLREIEKITAKAVFDEAKKGDALALEAVEILGSYLGRALAYVSCVVNPEVFVIGGGVSKAGDILIDTIQKHYKQKAFPACRDARFVIARLGNDAGGFGAAKLILGE